MKFCVALILLIILPLTALGRGEVESAKVVKVRVDNDGRGYIAFDQPLGGVPATCSNEAHKSHLAFDANTEAGKAIMALGLFAKATGKMIFARGTDTCDSYAIVESWHWGYVHEGE
ncbi:hypothetical protein [Gilvimarinus algae]|uniref:Uncharacterized protein n=1 Tax=Gilvimarinus algae TaxID=3058037 RepID=A0ABT8TGY4_9GAMM|nr:hypothetical protein [Gilvimarinus sp. SDUM040014]MDO3382378.1 hypothetical protein [Gilvimarinus sp. SDUM040014]